MQADVSDISAPVGRLPDEGNRDKLPKSRVVSVLETWHCVPERRVRFVHMSPFWNDWTRSEATGREYPVRGMVRVVVPRLSCATYHDALEVHPKSCVAPQRMQSTEA